jgi:hypothetical protein
MGKYRAILSSDWNECLAPCGPFDFIAFTYPDLSDRLETIFRRYTTNAISLGEAAGLMRRLLPRPISADEMDAYLDAAFATYPGLPEWIEWCLAGDILFMINTTGMVGYFQRIFAKGLLPTVPALSANPMLRFGGLPSDPGMILDLLEIQDKPKNTEAALRAFGITSGKIIVMGDSGGDGPHFEWGTKVGALLVGSRTKSSLAAFCEERDIPIDVRFGGEGGKGGPDGLSFMELAPVIEDYLHR